MPVLILLSLFLLFDQILIFFRAQVKCQLNCNTSSSPHLHVLRVFLLELWDNLSYRIAFTCLSVALSCWTVSSSRPDTLSSPCPVPIRASDLYLATVNAHLLTEGMKGPLSVEPVCPSARNGDGFLLIYLLAPHRNL